MSFYFVGVTINELIYILENGVSKVKGYYFLLPVCTVLCILITYYSFKVLLKGYKKFKNKNASNSL